MSNENETKHISFSNEPIGSKKKEEDEEYKGPPAKVLDPVGKGLGKVLSPVGTVVNTITMPIEKGVGSITRPIIGPFTGEKEEKMEVLGGKNLDSYEHGKDSMGGRVQHGENPLGLDQSGKWGFREE